MADFRSAARKFKRLMVTYFMGKEPEDEVDFQYHYVVMCGPETEFSKKVEGKCITPDQLAEMFPGDWADALLRIKDKVTEEAAAG